MTAITTERRNAGGEQRRDDWGEDEPNDREGRTIRPWGGNKDTLDLNPDNGRLLPLLRQPSRWKSWDEQRRDRKGW